MPDEEALGAISGKGLMNPNNERTTAARQAARGNEERTSLNGRRGGGGGRSGGRCTGERAGARAAGDPGPWRAVVGSAAGVGCGGSEVVVEAVAGGGSPGLA